MSKSFLIMMFTCFTAVAVYYLCEQKLNLPDILSMAAGITAAVILSWLFSKRQRKKEQD
ncbi:MAG: hypothetical protein K9L17_05290 [Clostridiales bacterium]|nr:hypothetical protein [Clostridiales bacterium]MCF8022085.1 hypothetical protein [Clostridiales bacterium]